jgi:hypothetical protein
MFSKVVLFATIAAGNLFNTQDLLPKQALINQEVLTNDFLQRLTSTTTSVLGNSVQWEVFTHKSFPRYSLRVKKDVKLCDTVEQVMYLSLAL